MKKKSEFLSENFQFFGGETFNTFEKACFRIGAHITHSVKHHSKKTCKLN